MYFSQGFHPKPVLMFGPALSLGVASLAEYVDIKVVPDGHLDTEGMPARLNEASQGGIEFFAARELAPEDPKLSQLMHESRYVAALPESTLAELGLVDAEAVAARVAQRRQGELRARRTVDGLGKNVDVGRYLIDARVGDDNGVLQAAGIAGTLVPITIDLRITPDGTAKISEALDALLDASEVAARFIRADLAFRVGDQRGTPLDLSLARKLIALEDHKRAAQAAAAAPPDLLELPELS